MRIESSVDNFYNSNTDKVLKNSKSIKIKCLDTQQVLIRENGTVDNSEAELEEQEVIKAIEKANKHFKYFDRRLEFSIHEKTKQILVKVIDTEDDSVIREIPSEKILDMVAKLWEISGIFVDEKR